VVRITWSHQSMESLIDALHDDTSLERDFDELRGVLDRLLV